jgi:hypothetical protein
MPPRRQFRLVLFASLLFCSALHIAAQSHLVGYRLGFSRTNTLFTGFEETNYKSGLSGGISYEYRFNKYFLAGASTLFNQRGFSSPVRLTDERGNQIGEFSFVSKFDYLSLPFYGGITFGDKLVGLVNIGLEPSLILSARSPVLFMGPSGNVTGRNSVRAGFSKPVVDVCGIAEIGCGYRIKERYWLFATVGYQHSLYWYSESNLAIFNQARHRGVTITAGFKLELRSQKNRS